MDDRALTPAMRLLERLPYGVERRYWRLRYPKKARNHDWLRENEGHLGQTLRSFVEHECIFLHIPKTGGVSVSYGLFGNIGGIHRNIRRYQRIFPQSEFERFFKFTVVRNPWDRLVSAYTYLMGGGGGDKENRRFVETHVRPFADFDTFVRGWVTLENVRLKDHFRPQTDFMRGRGGHYPLDYVARFEQLADEFTVITKQIGIEADLPHMNKTSSRRRDYRSYYSDSSAEIVANVYQTDIMQLGYRFDD